jgi:hypothetical protein
VKNFTVQKGLICMTQAEFERLQGHLVHTEARIAELEAEQAIAQGCDLCDGRRETIVVGQRCIDCGEQYRTSEEAQRLEEAFRHSPLNDEPRNPHCAFCGNGHEACACL